MRRKSFSLVLLIFIAIMVILLVVCSILLINSGGSDSISNKKRNNETEISQKNEISDTVLDSSFFDSLNNIETNSSTVTSENNTTIEENTNTTSSENTIPLNNHSYKFGDSVTATVATSTNGKQEIVTKYPDKNYTIYYGSDSSKSFENLKNDSNLQATIESSYNVKVTSALKQGKVSNLDLIVCTISEDETKKAYFLITPLNSEEIAYSKIYNSDNNETLISDLSEPLNSLVSIISSIQ